MRSDGLEQQAVWPKIAVIDREVPEAAVRVFTDSLGAGPVAAKIWPFPIAGATFHDGHSWRVLFAPGKVRTLKGVQPRW